MRHEIMTEPEVDEIAGKWQIPDSEEPETGTPKIRSIADIPSFRVFATKKMDFTVEGIVAAGAVTAFTGDPGCGKSTIVTAMSGAIRDSQRFAGLETQNRPILMLDRDNSISGINERFDRLGLDDGGGFTLWGGWLGEEAPSPSSTIVLDFVRSCKTPAPMIVVDCMAAFLEGDENDAGAVRAFMQTLRGLANLGCPVIILHHTGKGDTTKDYRGSSDFKASIDVGFTVTNLGDPARLERVKVKAFKSRFTVDSDMLFHYNDGRFRLDHRPAVRTNDDLLRELLIANPGIGTRGFEAMAAEKKLIRSRARTFLDNGIHGRVIRVDTVGKARYHTWIGESSEKQLYT